MAKDSSSDSRRRAAVSSERRRALEDSAVYRQLESLYHEAIRSGSISAQAMADRSNVSRTTLHRWFSGDTTKVPIDVAEILADLFGYTLQMKPKRRGDRT